MPSRNLTAGSVYTVLGAILVGLAGLFSFRDRASSPHAGGTPLGTGPSIPPGPGPAGGHEEVRP
jgi:hypothetical protein